MEDHPAEVSWFLNLVNGASVEGSALVCGSSQEATSYIATNAAMHLHH